MYLNTVCIKNFTCVIQQILVYNTHTGHSSVQHKFCKADIELAAIWAPFTSLLMPFMGPTDPVVHLVGLTGSAKRLSVKADSAICSHVFGISK